MNYNVSKNLAVYAVPIPFAAVALLLVTLAGGRFADALLMSCAVYGIFAILGSFVNDFSLSRRQLVQQSLTPPEVVEYLTDLCALHASLILFGGGLAAVVKVTSRSDALTLTSFCLFGVFVYVAGIWYMTPGVRHIRGRLLVAFEEAVLRAKKLLPAGDPGLSFGWLTLPYSMAVKGFLVLGSIGAGKTMLLQILMKSVLPRMKKGSDSRAMIYDAKKDIVSTLSSLNLKVPVVLLHPFDARSASWDMAADITTPADALQMAMTLIPEEETTNRYFTDGARDLLHGIVLTFIQACPGLWTFRDVLLVADSKKLLKAVLTRTPSTKGQLEYFEPEDTFSNVFTTIRSKLAPYHTIAASWHRAKQKVSLEHWARHEYCLVLGSDDAQRVAIEGVNKLLFKRASEIVLSAADSKTRRTWFFLDEGREAGKLEGISSLLVKGRSKGACVVLGLQSVEGFRHVHGDKVANELLGQCHCKVVLHLEDPETAEFAAKLIGEYEGREIQRSWNRQGYSASEHVVKRESVLPSEFLSLPPATPENGLSGFCSIADVGVYKMAVSGEEVAKALIEKTSKTPDFIPRPAQHQYLAPFTDEDLKRLGLDGNPDDDEGELGGSLSKKRSPKPPAPKPSVVVLGK